MSNAKTGGNKKASSPSDQNYWKRAEMGKFSETHKEKRIARHMKRSKTNKTQLAAANALSITISYPKRQAERPKERVTFGGSVVPEMRTFDEHGNVMSRPMFIIKNGVITDVLRTKVAA